MYCSYMGSAETKLKNVISPVDSIYLNVNLLLINGMNTLAV